MRLTFTLDYQQYALPPELSALEVGTLFKALSTLQKVETKHTPDYAVQRIVPEKESIRVQVILEKDDKFCTEEEFKSLCVAHPKKDEPEEDQNPL